MLRKLLINQTKTFIMANHSIVLTVNTASIPASPTTKELIDANCSFGQTSGSNEEYNVNVVNTDTVTWSGSTSTANHVVYITHIDYESGTNLFGSTDLTPASVGESVVGTVQNAGTSKLVDTYKILFDVFKNGALWGSYEIDPKITMTSGGAR